jgi:predicted nucleotidyltransferase
MKEKKEVQHKASSHETTAKKEPDYSKDRDIALDFATKTYKKFRDVIKAIAMFGSAARHDQTNKSDIDIVIIIDDCTVNWDDELIAWYREELAKIVAENKYAKELHVNTVTLTAFWEEMRAGEPLVINVLRYGEPLIDVGGFFDPLKVLLAKGKIRPTPEAIFTTMQRAGQHLGRANTNILNSVEGFYWAMVDASHAALMAMRVVPPSPEQLPELLTSTLVDHGLIGKEYVDWYNEVRAKAKSIMYGEISQLDGKELEQLQTKSLDFVLKLNELTKGMIANEKIITYNLKD